jgi:transcriptional regulator
MGKIKAEVPYGTLDLLILRIVDTMGRMHGFGIARRIEQVSENVLRLNQGSIYPALLRLEHNGWLKTEWGASENGRQAKFYSITRVGRKRLHDEVENWERMTALVGSFLRATS